MGTCAEARLAADPAMGIERVIDRTAVAKQGGAREASFMIAFKPGFEPGRDVHLCYCPERVLPGNTVAELVNNDRIMGNNAQMLLVHRGE